MSSPGSMDKLTSDCDCDTAPCVKVCPPKRKKKNKQPTSPQPGQRPYGGGWSGGGGGGGGSGGGGKFGHYWRRWWHTQKRFGDRFVQTRTVTVAANSVGPGCTQNPYRTGVIFQRVDTGGSPTIVRVHQSGSSPYTGGVPTAFVGFIETRTSNLAGPFTWPPDLHFSEELSRVIESDLCLVNTDPANAQVFTVAEIFDLRSKRGR